MDAEAELMDKENVNPDDEPPSDVVAIRDEDAKKKETRKNVIRTIFDGLVYLFLGMEIAQMGPSFLDLQYISGTDVKGASSYCTGSNFGYMVGALMAGFIYDRLGNKVILIFLPLTLASFLIGVTPLFTSYIIMLSAHIVSSMLCAIAETTINADQLSIWQGESDAALQFLSFTYSLGGVLGPLYTEPFLVPKWNESANNAHQSQAQEGNPKTNNISNLIYDFQNSSVSSISFVGTSSNADFEGNLTDSFSNFEDPPESQLYYAYMITGFFGILFSIPFYFICCKNCSKSSQKGSKNKNEEPVEVKQKRLTLTPYIVLTTISCIFFFFYSMIEDSFNMFLSMFVVSHLSWTKENGALISSLYWGISTISKLISVPLVRRFDLGVILLISSVGMVISLVGFLISSTYRIDVLIWMTSSLFSMSQSAIFGGCFSWVDTNILKLDGKATCVSMVSGSCGAMIGPLILGITMDKFSLMVFPIIELILSVIITCIFASMFFFLEPFVTKKYGPVRPKSKDIDLSVDGKDAETVVEEEKSMISDVDEKCVKFEMKESNGHIST